jgi:F0F1-type ATP synthase membrane subunit b/b'
VFTQSEATREFDITLAALIDLDASFFAMLGLFLLLFFILNKIIHQPMLAMFEKRHALTDGAREAAAVAVDKAEKQISAYEERLKEARRKAVSEQKNLREEGLAREREVLAEVRTETTGQIESGVAELQRTAASMETDLKIQADELGEQVVVRLIGAA